MKIIHTNNFDFFDNFKLKIFEWQFDFEKRQIDFEYCKILKMIDKLISKNDKMMWIYDLFFYLATIWFRKTSRWCEKGIIKYAIFGLNNKFLHSFKFQ